MNLTHTNLNSRFVGEANFESQVLESKSAVLVAFWALPDRLIRGVSPGKEVDVEVSGLEGMPPLGGRISEVGVAASAEGRLFRVVIKVPNPDGLLRSGMTARVRIGNTRAIKPGTVRVPLSALVILPASGGVESNASRQLGVFVVRDGQAVQRAVKTGDLLNSSILITEISVGERVVTWGAGFPYDGAPVEVALNPSASR